MLFLMNDFCIASVAWFLTLYTMQNSVFQQLIAREILGIGQ